MTDLPIGLAPQFSKEEEGNEDILYQILIELKKINTQLILITDNAIKEQDIVVGNKEEIP